MLVKGVGAVCEPPFFCSDCRNLRPSFPLAPIPCWAIIRGLFLIFREERHGDAEEQRYLLGRQKLWQGE